MCGRQACTLAPDQVSKSCQYKDKFSNTRQPQWVNFTSQHRPQGEGNKYTPSPNIGPKTATPILLSPKKVPGKETKDGKAEERVLCEMQWGLVPSWHKGSFEDFKFNMINCRSDTILEKASFRGPLDRGQRCVAVAEGFYEWKTEKDGTKQPYFIHFNPGRFGDDGVRGREVEDAKVGIKKEDDTTSLRSGEIKAEDKVVKAEEKRSEAGRSYEKIAGHGVREDVQANIKKEDDVIPSATEIESAKLKSEDISEIAKCGERETCCGKRLVYMAALYDTWKAPGAAEPRYTYTIITVNSSSSLSWLHDRMPAILETEEQVSRWLNVGEVRKNEAIKLLKPADCLNWYPVSTVVNSVKNKTDDCMKEIDLTKKTAKKSGSGSIMGFFTKKRPIKHEYEVTHDSGTPSPKKEKLI
eukprot:gene15303-16880_t